MGEGVHLHSRKIPPPVSPPQPLLQKHYNVDEPKWQNCFIFVTILVFQLLLADGWKWVLKRPKNSFKATSRGARPTSTDDPPPPLPLLFKLWQIVLRNSFLKQKCWKSKQNLCKRWSSAIMISTQMWGNHPSWVSEQHWRGGAGQWLEGRGEGGC